MLPVHLAETAFPGLCFMDLFMKDILRAKDVEAFAEYWFEQKIEMPLHSFLGMTAVEDSLWEYANPESLLEIRAARTADFAA